MRIICSVFATVLCFHVHSQIVLTSADMPVAGDTFFQQRDLSPANFTIGPSGANRTWNFSTLQADELDTAYVVAPSATPYAADFPNANLALTNDFNFYLYYRNTSTALKVEGFANIDPNLGQVSVNFNPIPDQHRFPATYLTNFSGTSGFQEAKPYNQLPPDLRQQIDDALQSLPGATVSQVRVTFSSSYKDTIDAWGTVITPIGTYDALRRKRIETSNTRIEAQVAFVFPPTSFWQELSNTTSTTTEHSWLSAITKLPLITLGYDSSRNVNAVTYATLAPPPPAPVAGFTWSNTSGGNVTFTSISQDGDTFEWDFGDGNTSSGENPQHSYAANGSYRVCLTVSNASGSDTFCDTVDVILINVNRAPVAARDSARVARGASVQLNVLSNDSDPDGDNISFQLVFPPLSGTTADLGGGLVSYSAGQQLIGVDSFNYTICDDGTPQRCDTGTVVITIDSFTTTGAPVAGSEMAIMPNPASFWVKVSASMPDPQWLEMMDMSGRTLFKKNVPAQEHLLIDVSALAPGMYICKLHGTHGGSVVGKVIKE